MIRTAILTCAAAAALLPASALAQTVGVNAAVAGDVRMTTDANRIVHKAVVRERVSLGNDILTGRASRLQVLLLDRTNFTVGPNAKIKVDRFVYDPGRKSSSVGMTVTRGAFRFMSGRPTHAQPGQSGIRTPTASIGIRGTIVEGVVGPDAIRIARRQGLTGFAADPETATLILLRGPGRGTQGGEIPGAIDVDIGGRVIPVTGSGQAVFIPAVGADPIGPFMIGDWGSAYLSGLLGTGRFGFERGYELGVPGSPLQDLFQFEELCAKAAASGPGQGGPNGPPAGVGSCAAG